MDFVAAGRDSVGNAFLRVRVDNGKRRGRVQRKWLKYSQFPRWVASAVATPPPNAAEARAMNSVAAARDFVGNALFLIQVCSGKRWGHVQRKWQNYRQICN
jgi:hypothetical protein